MDLKQTVQESAGNIMLLWNSSDRISVTEFTVFVTLTAIGSEFIFTTTNTSIQIPVLYNQHYIVRVVASNCAGSSVPEEISFKIGESVYVVVVCSYSYTCILVHIIVDKRYLVK